MLLRLNSLYVENSTSTPTQPYTQPEWKRNFEGRKDFFTCNNKIVVRKMPQSLFIECLVEHFNICYERGKNVWPRRKRIDTNM